jgi:signal transduction histidine kinase
MNTEQHNILKNTGSDKNRSYHIKGSSKSANSSVWLVNKEETNDQLLLRLQKMEEINAQLENLVEESSRKLAETVATNARFLSIVAHDLKSPFSTMISILDLLSESLNDYNKIETKKLIDIASNSALRTYNLLENLLAWSISQNIEKTFDPVKINLNELIKNEFESFITKATKKDITLLHSVLPDLHITADLQMTKAIFRNLISNAIKYSNPGGQIIISAIEGKKFVEIEVTDYGVGISKKTQEKLFKIDEFQSTIGTDNEHGTGLGLLFCKEFIGMHGGKIQIESEQGKGCKIKFNLPHYI